MVSDGSWSFNDNKCEGEIFMKYVERADIYVQHIDGTLYSPDDWESGDFANEDANGVAVVRPISGSFVIAKEAATYGFGWGGYDTTITDIVTAESFSTAVLDNDGAGNTLKIIEQLSGITDSHAVTGAPAAEYCVGYTFPNGKTGYLGALGEWEAVFDNLAKIQNILNNYIGGSGLTASYYWTSTQGSSNDSWMIYTGNGSCSTASKSNVRAVRAFCPLS